MISAATVALFLSTLTAQMRGSSDPSVRVGDGNGPLLFIGANLIFLALNASSESLDTNFLYFCFHFC